MSVDEGLIDWIRESTEPLGSLSLRKMMGGATLYLDSIIFAMVDGRDGNTLWFKSDAMSDAVWDGAVCEKFTYTFPNGKTGHMNYRRAPDDVYDDGDALLHWARLALEAGLRAPVKKAKKR